MEWFIQGKATTLQAHIGPKGSRRLIFRWSAQAGGEAVSPTLRPPLAPPKGRSVVLICERLNRPTTILRPEGLSQCKVSGGGGGTIWNQNCDLPSRSAVLQTSALSRIPYGRIYTFWYAILRSIKHNNHVCNYKVVQIWPGLFVCKQVTVCPGHIWTTLYKGQYDIRFL